LAQGRAFGPPQPVTYHPPICSTAFGQAAAEMLARIALAAAAGLGACTGERAPAEEVFSLVQTKVAEGPAHSPAEETLDLNSLDSVTAYIQKLKSLKTDIKVAVEIRSPGFDARVTQQDAVKAQEYISQLDAQAREIKMNQMPIVPGHKPAPTPRVNAIQGFFKRIRASIYAREQETVHITASNQAMCMQGSTHYMRRVLSQLRKSPLQYAWTFANLATGECKDHGFKEKATESQDCFKSATVWVDKLHRHAYNNFNQEQVQIWERRKHLTNVEAREAMPFLCLGD